jgi:hypothetical protein
LVIPTALGCPPKLNAKELSSESYNSQTLCLSSLASMSGCCQVQSPHNLSLKILVLSAYYMTLFLFSFNDLVDHLLL